MNLTTLFKLKNKGMISVIGAGGKTSLMFTIAAELVAAGKKVMTTTTTKIFYPSNEQCPQTLIEPDLTVLMEKAAMLLPRTCCLAAGSAHDPVTDKVTGFDIDDMAAIFQSALFDWIIVEADGAKRKPAKASNATEPVIPCATTLIIFTTGLDAVMQPLNANHIHRPEIFSKNTGLAMGKPVTFQDLATNISLEIEKAKKMCQTADICVFLNKADTEERKHSGKKIIRQLRDRDPNLPCAIGCLQPEFDIKYHCGN